MEWTKPPAPAEGKVNHRVIVVEDITRRFAELLGVRLNVPPEFFIAHCGDSTLNLSVVDQGSTLQHDRYWRVSVTQRRWVKPVPKERSGWYHVEFGFFDSHKVYLDDKQKKLRAASSAVESIQRYCQTPAQIRYVKPNIDRCIRAFVMLTRPSR